MLSETIIKLIEKKFGKKNIQSGDCASLAGEIGIGQTTVKRLLGLVGENSPERHRVPHTSTMDLLSQWLGYDNYKSLIRDLDRMNSASEFTSMSLIECDTLETGSQIQVRYEPGRLLVMTYLGNQEFVINESKNSKLLKGDRLKLSHLILGQEMIVKDVIRANKNLGGYR
ncbi:MAG: hypothetical protein K2K29_07545, partial [Muribaculaceae bacterium]|nr:hypothetical protein [Muribaculaceae bacterium]